MSATDTTFFLDQSHFNSAVSLSGYDGTTHKITEGTGYIDPAYASRMNGWRTSAHGKMLGSYHVLHTADPAGQLQFWIEQQDKLTPWWRDWPHWVMQIDAEKWPNDPVTLTSGTYVGPLKASHQLLLDDADVVAEALQARQSTTITFAGMLKGANLPGLQICYASRGQYGDNLTGIPLPLWNAAYRGVTYPGNDSADWQPYSGKEPVFLQWTSTPYDKNAFRGTNAELLAFIEGGADMPINDADVVETFTAEVLPNPTAGGKPVSAHGILAPTFREVHSANVTLAAQGAKLDALTAKVDALGGTVTPPVITQQMLDLAMLNALKALAGGQA